MTPIIFLDLDGPMIPWWGYNYTPMDDRGGKIIPDFPFLSQFHWEAIAAIQTVALETGAQVVANTTHNKKGYTHIRNIFEANGIEDLLVPDDSISWPKYMSGFNNGALKDWRGRKDRALGIKAWFTHFGLSMEATPFIAIDDSVGDFQKYNTTYTHYTKIPYIQTGLSSTEYFNIDDMNSAIQTIQNHPNYTRKI